MNKRYISASLFFLFLVALSQLNDSTLALESNTNKIASATETSSVSDIKLITPVLKDTKPKQSTKSNPKTTAKINLKAIIFDPNAQFDAEAKAECREMTRLEDMEENIHEALHGEVTTVKKMAPKGLLASKTKMTFKNGPIESISPWFVYKGSFQNAWTGGNYQNSLYDTDSNFLVLDGKFKNKKTTFRIMPIFSQGKDGHDFLNDVWGDVYITHAVTKQDQFVIGNSRDIVGLEGSASPNALPFFARSQIAKTYNNVRSLGARAQGQHKMYDYSIGLFSSGRNFVDWFPGPEFVSSIGFKPLGMTDGRYGKLLMGGGIQAGNADNKYTVGSAYIDYEYKRLNATLEYASADGSNGSTGCTANQSEGLSGTLAYRISPKWEALVRYDQFDPNKTTKNDIRREYTAGLNYYIKEQALRLILNYTVYSIETGVYGTKFLTGVQIII